jgi:hypothetical protein
MLLTTLSAGAIVHSTPLTKFAVTGRYQVCPWVKKIIISTQQSTWIKMALKNRSGASVLGSKIGH